MQVVIEVPPMGGQLRVVRRLVEGWASAVAADPSRWTLVATELVSNAFNASPDEGSVIVRLECDDRELRLVVVDEGPGFTLGDLDPPAPDAVRGRGLSLVAGSVDSLTVERIDGLTVVTAAQRA